MQLETQNGTYPITFPMVLAGKTRAFTVVFKPVQAELDFEAIEVRFASGEKVTGDMRYQLTIEAKRHLFAILESMASDEPVGTFDRNERVLVAYYYTIVCYLRDDVKVSHDNHSLPILYAAAKTVASRIANLHEQAHALHEDAPREYFEPLVKTVLQEMRQKRETQGVLFWDSARWEFFQSCLATTFNWRQGKISSRALRLAQTIMPEQHRRTIREAGG